MNDAQPTDRYDLVLAGGRVVDGTGAQAYRADVGLRGGIIAGIGRLADAAAVERVDVAGHVITPGFVDMLHNFEMGPFTHPDAEMAVAQGVTTALAGGCGMAAAPVSAATRADVRSHLMFKSGHHRHDLSWEAFGDYLDAIDRRSAINVASLFGFDNLWFAVRGFDASRPSSRELDEMRDLAARSMAEGAIGMSHGAAAASLWSTHEDVVHVARGLAEAGGVYAVHQRSVESEDPFAALREGVAVGREAGVAVHFLHFKSIGPRTHGREQEMLQIVDDAIAEGLEVTIASYPYGSGGGGLRVPAWAEEGGPSRVRERLRDPETRAKIAAEMDEFWGGETLGESFIMNVQSERFEHLLGMSMQQAAEAEGVSVGELCCLLLEDEESAVQHMHKHGGQESFDAIIQHPAHICVSDAIYAGVPHPRCYGSYPRYLQTYVQERKVLTLEEFVRQSTSAPAARMGLTDRGAIKVGLAADLVVLDPPAVVDRATYTDPGGRAEGFAHVLVNGEFVMRDGKHLSGVRAGRALRRYPA